MPDNLTDELRVINACISFASEKGLHYIISTCPTISPDVPKRIEIALGEGVRHDRTKTHFGACFGVTEDGNSPLEKKT